MPVVSLEASSLLVRTESRLGDLCTVRRARKAQDPRGGAPFAVLSYSNLRWPFTKRRNRSSRRNVG
jgi:hypothetical protein